MEFNEDDLLNISGIQHYSFCMRQWALIHIEKQWAENIHTVEGNIVHEKAHDTTKREHRGKIIITRGLEIRSRDLGIEGICDVVEFHESNDGVQIQGLNGRYLPIPIEYKKGKPKTNNADRLQLCCQAMCLEEMLMCEIKYAFLYYDAVKKREKVELGDALRNEVISLLKEMHNLFQRRYTPRVKKAKKCEACSLMDICMPELNDKSSAKSYIERMLKS